MPGARGDTYLGVPLGLAIKGSGTVTAMAQVTAVIWVRSLAQDLPHAAGTAKEKKNTNLSHNYIKINELLCSINISYKLIFKTLSKC